MVQQADNTPRPQPQGHEGLSSYTPPLLRASKQSSSALGGWVGAGQLQVRDKIRQADGTLGRVANVSTIAKTQQMFNLTVDEAHTFYVGNNGWLVHNCDPLFSEKYGVQFNPLQNVFNGRKGALGNALENSPGIGSYTKDYAETLTINNPSVLAAIDHTYGSTKGWVKVVADGFDATGNKIGFHYFRGPNGEVFGQKFVDFWSRDFRR